MSASLLPDNRTVLEDALGIATDPAPAILAQIEAVRSFKYARPLSISVAPWLIYEYGLGPISQFFVTVEDAIDEGRVWQRIRGTPAAITTSFSWIGYDTVTIEDQVRGRRRWHLYQLGMGELPGLDEVTRLTSAEYLAGLSDPARSYFWRGYHGYDVRGHVYGRSRWGRSMWGDSSGVRLPGGKVKWSHGRSHAVSGSADPADLVALAVDYENGDPLTWLPTIIWAAPGVTWEGVVDARALKSWLMRQRQAHIGLYGADGNPVGYAAVLHEVADVTDYGSLGVDVELVYEASVAFGEAVGAVASVAVVFGGVSAANKPFKAWLTPAEIEFPDAEIKVGESALALTFLKTVRERIVVNLTI